MALAVTVWEVRINGNSKNGGGWSSVYGAGLDLSQQDNPQYSVTDGVTTGTASITSATANFGLDVIGNIVYIEGGTGSIVGNRYQISGRPNATTINLDRNTGLTAGTGATLRIGGALSWPLINNLITSAGHTFWVKSGIYTMNATGLGVQGGRVQTQSNLGDLIGYGNVRGDNIRPIFELGIAGYNTLGISMFSAQGIGGVTKNFILRGNSFLGSTAFAASNNTVINCLVENFSGVTAFANAGGGPVKFLFCEAKNISGAGSIGFNIQNNGYAYGCVSNGVSGAGFSHGTSTSNSYVYINCLAISGGRGFVGPGGQYINCTSVYNSGFGFGPFNGDAYDITAINCLAAGNGTTGFSSVRLISSIMTSGSFFLNCGGFGNKSGNFGVPNTPFSSGAGMTIYDFKSLTNDPFNSPFNGDFRLNNLPDGGRECRNGGHTGIGGFPNASGFYSTYSDIGALQHRDQESISSFAS